jgi:hypothetical protein
MDIAALLSVAKDNQNSIDRLTLAEVAEEIETVLEPLIIDEAARAAVREKLAGYQWISEVDQLKLGRWIRWLPMKTYKLTNGGFLADIVDDCLLCRNGMGRLIQFKFDDALIFQKFSADEMLVLLASSTA